MLKEVLAPMPGLVVEVKVKAGDQVNADDELVVLEAMKMEIPVMSPQQGVIKSVNVEPKQHVSTNQILLSIEI